MAIISKYTRINGFVEKRKKEGKKEGDTGLRT
jgi:hypothetical protein